MSEFFDQLLQQISDLQEMVDAQQAAIDDYENRLEALENTDQSSPDQFPLDPNLQTAIEQTVFQTITAQLLKGGIPIYTVARNTTQSPPMQGEMWLEDISGVRKIHCWISGADYKVTIA